MSILYVDLDEEKITASADESEKGVSLALSLLRKRSSERTIVFTSTPEEALETRGASTYFISFVSPVTGRETVCPVVSSVGLILMNMGYTALVITGRCRKMSVLSFRGDSISIKHAEFFRGKSRDYVNLALGPKGNDVVFSTSIAADRNIPYGALYLGSSEVGFDGLGSRCSDMNVKAMKIQAFLPERRQNEESRRFSKSLMNRKVARSLRTEGTLVLIDRLVKKGMAPLEGFERRFDPRAVFLDGSSIRMRHGASSLSCSDCPIGCHKRTEDGGRIPEIEDAMYLGTNLGIFSSDSVMQLKAKIDEYGLEPFNTGMYLSQNGVRGLDDALKAIESIMDGSVTIQVPHAGYPRLDYRGSYEGAIFHMKGERLVPLIDLYAEENITNITSAAIAALYERVYTYALSSRGYAIVPSFVEYLSDIPGWMYRTPEILRLHMRKIRFYGINPKDLLKEGLAILEKLDVDEVSEIDERFLYKPDMAYDDAVCPSRKLLDAYERERLRLIVHLSDKSAIRKRS